MRRFGRSLLIASLAVGLLVMPVSAKSSEPASLPDLMYGFEAGVVCSFEIQIEEWTNARTRVVDDQGQEKTVVVGTTRSKVTNVDDDTSTWVQSDSRVVYWEPGDGTFLLRSSGRQLFYFLDGDKNPVGVGKGLFLVRGDVEETLDYGSDSITEFSIRGSYTDICADLAG